MQAFPISNSVPLIVRKEKTSSEKIALTSQHKLPDSEILSFFLSHKTQLLSVSFPLNHHWSIPCRCLCACKTRVRQHAWDGDRGEGKKKSSCDRVLYVASRVAFDQVTTCLGSSLLYRPVRWYWTFVGAIEGVNSNVKWKWTEGKWDFSLTRITLSRPTFADPESATTPEPWFPQATAACLTPSGDKAWRVSEVKEKVVFKMI